METICRALLLVVAAVSATTLSPLSAESAEITDYDWRTYGNDPGSSKYADLDQINKDTVRRLKVVWSWSPPDNDHVKNDDTNIPGSFKGTPIKIGNVLYISTSLGYVAAIDAVTGKQMWVFDTKTYEHGYPANSGFNHRGVAYWHKGNKRRIIIGTNNGFLWSLDAATGLPDRTFGTGGKVDLTIGLGREIERKYYSISAAPVIVGDTVVFGGIVLDAPIYMLPPGHVRGYDLNDGKQKWIFHSIPQQGEKWNETWENNSWKTAGATNVWTLMSADLELGYVYLPFGSPSNDWYGGERLGDNVFGNSLVCLDAGTGKLVWHYQTIHHDLWDYDLPAAPTLIDITVAGKKIRAVAQVSKQGFLYVFDRLTGKPVWPIEELTVSQTRIPGERSSPTQPYPTWPKPFERQGFSVETLIDFTAELRAEAMQIMAQYDIGGIFTPPSTKGTFYLPGWGGGAEWTGAAFDPDTSMYYIPSRTQPIVMQLKQAEPGASEFRYLGTVKYIRGPKRLPLTKPPYTRVSAVNLNTGEYEWMVANGDGLRQQIIDAGVPDPGPVGGGSFTGPLLTKSLLFMGGHDGKPLLRAFDKATGEIIHETELPLDPFGTPMTYMVDGKQYISVAVGGTKDARLLALALP